MVKMDDVAIEMRGILEREYAPIGQVVSYSDLAKKIATRAVRPEFMDRQLAAISRETASETRGAIMLSALVVNKETLEPGSGFFRLARELGILPFHDHDRELAFWLDQLAEIKRRYRGP